MNLQLAASVLALACSFSPGLLAQGLTLTNFSEVTVSEQPWPFSNPSLRHSVTADMTGDRTPSLVTLNGSCPTYLFAPDKFQSYSHIGDLVQVNDMAVMEKVAPAHDWLLTVEDNHTLRRQQYQLSGSSRTLVTVDSDIEASRGAQRLDCFPIFEQWLVAVLSNHDTILTIRDKGTTTGMTLMQEFAIPPLARNLAIVDNPSGSLPHIAVLFDTGIRFYTITGSPVTKWNSQGAGGGIIRSYKLGSETKLGWLTPQSGTQNWRFVSGDAGSSNQLVTHLLSTELPLGFDLADLDGPGDAPDLFYMAGRAKKGHLHAGLTTGGFEIVSRLVTVGSSILDYDPSQCDPQFVDVTNDGVLDLIITRDKTDAAMGGLTTIIQQMGSAGSGESNAFTIEDNPKINLKSNLLETRFTLDPEFPSAEFNAMQIVLFEMPALGSGADPIALENRVWTLHAQINGNKHDVGFNLPLSSGAPEPIYILMVRPVYFHEEQILSAYASDLFALTLDESTAAGLGAEFNGDPIPIRNRISSSKNVGGVVPVPPPLLLNIQEGSVDTGAVSLESETGH